MPETVPAVLIDGVWKTFRMPHTRVHTLKERVLHPLRRTTHDEFEALRNVSLSVDPGEFFAIVGRNGSGKSTLLKCLAGIYATDRGRIYVDGRLSSFIELGVGFNPDLAARDNAMLNATMLGLTPREARRRFDAIIDFAELHDFTDLKLKNYSSGMLVRLAFAVMIQVDAEVLLIDEVLAVGDAAFQQKCYDEFAGLRRRGATVLLVTHDMGSAQRFCDRGMLLEHGEVVEIGGIEQVAGRYLELNFGRGRPTDDDGRPAVDDVAERWGDGRARVVDAWFEDEHGEQTDVLPTGRECTCAVRVVFATDVLDPVFSLVIEHPGGALIATADVGMRAPSGAFSAGEEVVWRTRLQNVLAPERYFVTPGVAAAGGLEWLDRPMRLMTLTVTGLRTTPGLVELPFDTEMQRAAGPALKTPIQ